MKRIGSSQLRARAANGSNVTTIERSTIHGNVNTGATIVNQVYRGRRRSRPTEYPVGSIGSDLMQRNYIKHLVELYHRFRQADSGFGREPARVNYSVIFKN